MDKLFLTLINMSITSSYVILCVILTRFFLKKAPKIYSYCLWSVVLLRLTIPFSFQSIFSFIRINTKAIPVDIMYSPVQQINSGIRVIDSVVNNSLPAPAVVASVNPMQIWIWLGQSIWILGLIVLVIYSIVTTVRLSKKLKSSLNMSNNIYENNSIKTPFVFGLVNPKIYLPKDLLETELEYIIKHEQKHIKRFDHIIKFIAFVVVSIHWFNPLVWLSFFLMTEDMELSCDEKVINELGNGIKKDYSSSLLSLSTGRKIVCGSPLAFGENNTKARIKNILNYKKPTFWISIVAFLVIVVVGLALLSNPKDIKTQDDKFNMTSLAEEEETATSMRLKNENYDRINEYMKQESTTAWSKYYELLDFQISNYEEKIVDGNVEATFFYKIIEKNYDKDPDTVKYIKEAKESGDKYYQRYYDEYLQPRESNFDFKIIIDKDDLVTLYSNIDPNGIEWEEVKMTDYIIEN